MEKRCSKCKTIKSINEFSKNRGTKDGLQCWCKGCVWAYRQIPKVKVARARYDQLPKCKAARIRQVKMNKQRWSLHIMITGFPKGTKVCKGCDRLKSVDKFGKCSGNKDGLATQCKECINIYQQSPGRKTTQDKANKKYRQTHKDEIVEQQKKIPANNQGLSS